MPDGPLLILTATIRPLTSVMLKLTDPKARRQQYLEALAGWLEQGGHYPRSILFIENSGEDLKAFQDLVEKHNPHGRRVELVSLSISYPQELGKGYGEFLAIDEGMARSTLAREHPSFAKCTGRIRVKNFDRVVRRLPSDLDFAGDVLLKYSATTGHIDSRLLFFSRRFYDAQLKGLYRQMNDTAGVIAENALYSALIADPNARVVTTLPVEPRWVGSSASVGVVYDAWSQRIRHPLRILRRAWRRGSTAS